MVQAGGPKAPRSIGGDEVAIMNVLQLAVHTDRRLFLADVGNYRILSVTLGYRESARLPLQDAPIGGRPAKANHR